MDHQDHVNLIRPGVIPESRVWAEFGSGSGHFTLALAEVLGAEGTIYSVDKNHRALQQQERRLDSLLAVNRPKLHFINADYTKPIELPPLDGVLLANALHFQRHKGSVLQAIHRYLLPGGRLIIVEYNVDRGNPWVPHPISYATWQALASQNGYTNTCLLGRVPSSFLVEFYSAVSVKPKE